jgi:hypothetical protein
MRYLLLIYTQEQLDSETDAAGGPELEEYNKFTEDIRARGLFEAGEALHPTSSATTVRVKDGQTVTTDGPFAETKEALGGFYMVKAKDLDEAIELAARIPAARHGSIEVRPIFDFADEMAAAGAGAGSASAGSQG